MKWMVSVSLLFLSFFSFSAKAVDPYPSYPLNFDPCSSPTATNYCVPVNDLVWALKGGNYINLKYTTNHEDIVQYVLQKVKTDRSCHDCIVITRENYLSMVNFNARPDGGQPSMWSPIYRNPSASFPVQDVAYTSYDDIDGRWVVIGKFEPYFSNGYEYRALRLYQIDEYQNNPFTNTWGGSHLVMFTGTCNQGAILSGKLDPVTNIVAKHCDESINVHTNNSATGLDTLIDGCTYGCNPVDLVTGAKLDYHVDYKNYSPYPIVVDRHYNSLMAGWTFSFERSLKHQIYNGDWQRATLLRPDGTQLSFTRVSGTSPWNARKPTHLGLLTTNMMSTNERHAYANLAGETEYYNDKGQLTKISSKNGLSTHYQYNVNEQLVKIQDDFGREIDISYAQKNGKHVIHTITDGDKTITYNIEPVIFSRKPRNLLHDVMFADGKIVSYVYDQDEENKPGLLLSIIGEDEKTAATYQYDSQNRVISSRKGETLTPKNQISYAYSSNSTNVTTGQNTSQVSVDQTIGKTRGSNLCTGCAGDTSSIVNYASDGAINNQTDKHGNYTQRTYAPNAKGLPLTETFYQGTSQQYTVSYTWDYNSRQPLTILEPISKSGGSATRTTTFTYDQNHRLTNRSVSVSDSSTARVESWTYNALGQVLTSTNPVTGTTTFTYDSQGNLLTKTNSMGHVWSYSNYTVAGLAQLVIDPNELHIETTYDERDRVTQIRRGHPDDHWEVTTMEYNDLGQVKKITQPDGQWISYVYDDAQQIVEESDPHGKIVYDFTPDGDLVAKTAYDTNNNVVELKEYEYDAKRRLSKIINAYNQQTQLSYTNYTQNKLHSVSDVDNNGDTRYMIYDAQGRHTGVTGDVQDYGETEYDKHGQALQFTDPHMVTTTTQYNSWGEIISTASGDYGTTTYTSNALTGLLESTMDARNVFTYHTYDSLGRLIRKDMDPWGNPSPIEVGWQAFIYDSGYLAKGRLTNVMDGNGSINYAYDRFGRVTFIGYINPGGPFLNSFYTYNNLGQLVSQQYPSGRVVNYQYTNGRVSNIEYDSQPVATNITWTPSGQIKGFDHLTGTDVKFFYDGNGRVQRIEDLDDRTYTRSPSGKILSITDAFDSTADQFFTYQPNKSLKQVNLAARSHPIDLNHNQNNNLQQKSVEAGWADEYFTNHWETRYVTNRPGTINEGFSLPYTMDFDASGNLLNDKKGLVLQYDQNNRMVTSNRLGISATYIVNPLGQRVRKSGSHLSTGHRYYAYDEESRLIGVYDGTGAAIEEFIYLDGYRVIASARNISTMSSTPELYAVYSDHLGTPRKVTNAIGMLLWSWDSKDPYGHQAPNEFHSGTTFEFDLRFPGQIFDNETGLYHNGFRDYDPKRGAYVQPDPIGLAGGMNPYSYAGGDPINFSDPTGLVIRYGEGESAKITRQTVEKLRSHSEEARALIDSIDQNPNDILTIRASTNLTDPFYDHKKKFIGWNPELYVHCAKTGKYSVTPEIQLLHEIRHHTQQGLAWEWANNVTRYLLLVDTDRWTDLRERNAITGIEKRVGEEFGLTKHRTSHNINWEKNPQRPIIWVGESKN